MHDVRVVPDALDGDLLAANLHAAHAATSRHACGIRKPVAPHKRADIIVVQRFAIDGPCDPARIGPFDVGERIGIHAHNGTQIIAEVVAHNDRLRTANEDRSGCISATANAVCARRAGGVVLDPAVGHAEVTLVRFNHIETVERALDGRLPTTVCDGGAINACGRSSVEKDAAPVTSNGHIR